MKVAEREIERKENGQKGKSSHYIIQKFVIIGQGGNKCGRHTYKSIYIYIYIYTGGFKQTNTQFYFIFIKFFFLLKKKKKMGKQPEYKLELTNNFPPKNFTQKLRGEQ